MPTSARQPLPSSGEFPARTGTLKAKVVGFCGSSQRRHLLANPRTGKVFVANPLFTAHVIFLSTGVGQVRCLTSDAIFLPILANPCLRGKVFVANPLFTAYAIFLPTGRRPGLGNLLAFFYQCRSLTGINPAGLVHSLYLDPAG